MNDPEIAAALLTSSPDALAELFDAYGDRLFRYCWSRLRNRETAQIALRDTLVVAQAHIARLGDRKLLGPWLYSLARVECRRHRPVPAAEADQVPARPSQPDADSRLMAWNAVMSMNADEFEVLDLACRHDVDLGLVLGVPAGEAAARLAAARQSLERALGAEILVSRGEGCPDRAEVLAGWTGVMTAQVRERVLGHAADCEVCGPNLPRNVSAARVFALLPVPALPPLARVEVLDFFGDHRLCAYREFAVGRAADLTESGFPAPPRRWAALRSSTVGFLAPPPAAPPPTASTVAAPAAPEDSEVSEVSVTPTDPAVSPDGAARPPLAVRRRRLPRASLLIAGAGVIASAVLIASALVPAGPAARPAAVRAVTPTVAAGSATGSSLQASGLGAGGAVPSSVPSLGPSLGPPARRRSLRARLSAPPPLVSTAGGQGQVMIAAATQPAPPARPPAPRRDAPPKAAAAANASQTPAAPGTLQLSANSVAVGTGFAGQITLTAMGGAVDWSASSSSPAQVSLSSYAGTLRAGQSVTLTVDVTHGPNAGSATLSFQAPGSAPQVVQVSWTATAYRPSPPGHPGPAPTSEALSQSATGAPASPGGKP